jgi:hypothetical protein
MDAEDPGLKPLAGLKGTLCDSSYALWVLFVSQA